MLFLLWVRSSMLPHMTSSVSNDVMFFHTTLEDVLITLNMKFHWNRLNRSRDIDVSVQTGSRILNRKWTLVQTKIIYFQKKTVVLITKVYFVFKSEQNWENFAKLCKFCKFWPTILNIQKIMMSRFYEARN